MTQWWIELNKQTKIGSFFLYLVMNLVIETEQEWQTLSNIFKEPQGTVRFSDTNIPLNEFRPWSKDTECAHRHTHTHEQRQYKHTRDRPLNEPVSWQWENLNRNQRVRDTDVSVIHYVASFQNPRMSKTLSQKGPVQESEERDCSCAKIQATAFMVF